MAGVSKRQRNLEAAAAKAITSAAYANPDHRCWRCGKTLATCGARGNGTDRDGNPATWDAGHRNGVLYAAECSPCNRADGARKRNALSSSGYDWPA